MAARSRSISITFVTRSRAWSSWSNLVRRSEASEIVNGELVQVELADDLVQCARRILRTR